MKVERGHIFSNRTHALAGFIKCRCCDGVMVQVSSKAGGYYGCSNAKKESCNNKQLISSRGVEAVILNDLKEKFLTVEGLKYADELLLKGLLGAMELEHCAHSLKTCSYYVAYTSIQTIALLDDEYTPEVWARNGH